MNIDMSLEDMISPENIKKIREFYKNKKTKIMVKDKLFDLFN